MRGFFDLGHPFWQMMGFLSDLMLLSLIWFIAILPIFTVGPATVALFSVAVHLNNHSGRGVWYQFRESFLRKFKSSLWMGIGILLLAVVLIVDVMYYHSVDLPIATFWLFVFLFIGVLSICFLLYFFPLCALYDWKLKKMLVTSFIAMIRNFKWTLFLFTVNGSVLFFTFYIAPYLVFFIIGGLAWMNVKVLLLLLEKGLLIHD